VRVLVLGAQGMLGAALVRQLSGRMDVFGTTMENGNYEDRLIRGVNISRTADIERAVDWSSPDAVVNCAGIVKGECSTRHASVVWDVNARAPHAIAAIAGRRGCRFLQVSTDCVFSGRTGGYREGDPTDAEDTYGKSKAAGEVVGPHCLTIRTSFVGRDPRRRRGLLEWLLARDAAGEPVQGYTRSLWSGLSAPELARAVGLALATPGLSGLYHVAGPTVSKADLLEALVLEGLTCRVERVDGPPVDRSLDGSRFAEATGYAPPTWAEMARELADD